MRSPFAALEQFVSDVDFVLYVGDVRDTLKALPDESIDCCVTSPPYWGLRDYGTAEWDGGDPGCDHQNDTQHQKQGASSQRQGRSNADEQRNENFRDVCGKCGAIRVDAQIGLEATPEIYVAALVETFREVHRVLADHGTLWLNLGDSYNAYNGGAGPGSKLSKTQTEARPRLESGFGLRSKELKPKDLVGIPWRVALALQEDGWTLRSDIIWSKPNPMPESVTDRPTKAHEYVFMFAKQARYFFDQDAVREPFAPSSEDRYRYASGGKKAEALVAQDAAGPGGNRTAPIGKRELPAKAAGTPRNDGSRWNENNGRGFAQNEPGRNIRSVWEIATQPYPEAHFATFPIELPRRCIAAGCPVGGTVLDPFMGSGTTALAARGLGRKAIGIELNPEYAALCARRLAQQSLLTEGAA